MIRQFVDSIVSKPYLDFVKAIRIQQQAKKLPKSPQREPLPISSGLPERIPVYKSFFHVVFPKSYSKVYDMKQDLLAKAKETALPKISVTAEQRELILGSPVTELLGHLNNDLITSQQVLYVYMERCQKLAIDRNYITDLCIEEAFAEARKCDEIRSQTPHNQRKNLGLLFGIPISVKENVLQKGYDSTCGLATRCFMPSKQDGLAMELLRKEGAIPFARSTVPQLLSVIETISHIWNRADNPWNASKSTGGSSGGEAGLIATNCSPIGIGTDGLGSLRIPAVWCGIYSFKPTADRINWKHSILFLSYLSEARWNVLYPSIGPMGKSVDDLILATKCLARKENREKDPHFPYLEWDDKQIHQIKNKKLRVGYVLTEEMFDTCKGMKRAVLEVIDELRQSGYEVEEIKIPNFNSMIRITLALMTSDGMSKGNLLALNGERLITELKNRLFLSFIPRWLRKFSMPLIRALGEERAAYLGNWTAGLTGDQWLWVLHEKDQVEQQFFNFWREKEFDAIITPGSALPALDHGTSGELALNVSYLWISNMFNLPAGIIPVTRVRKGEDHYGKDDSVHIDWLYRQAADVMKNTEGLPLGVQVLTLPFEDEKCLGIMKLLQEKFPAMIKNE